MNFTGAREAKERTDGRNGLGFTLVPGTIGMTRGKKVRSPGEGIRFADIEHTEGFDIDSVNRVTGGDGQIEVPYGETGGRQRVWH